MPWRQVVMPGARDREQRVFDKDVASKRKDDTKSNWIWMTFSRFQVMYSSIRPTKLRIGSSALLLNCFLIIYV